MRELAAGRHVPSATYRLQFNASFPFHEAAALVPYLRDLGVGDVYASPVLAARPGSPHGYDICDHARVNPELGGEEGLDELSAALRSHGMGLLLDTVPNHMGIGHPSNTWWNDVLEHGPASRYAAAFDIDWHPVNPDLQNKVLIPVLGEQYGQVLEAGKVRLNYEDGAFFLTYYEARLPVAPKSSIPVLEARLGHLAEVLGDDNEHVEELRSIITALGNLPPRKALPPQKRAERYREVGIVKRRLAAVVQASPEVRAAVESGVELFNGKVGTPASFDRLHELIEVQSYRPAFWRVAAEEINYRRFFDVNDLAAIRPEDPEVFRATHGLLLRLLAEGKANGLRIDHPDGLSDPKDYFRRLQECYALDQVRLRLSGAEPGARGAEAERDGAAARSRRVAQRTEREVSDELAAAGGGPWPLYVVAEKILGEGEPLPEDWAVDGTTGYDFLNAVNGLFVAKDNCDRMERIYRDFGGGPLALGPLVKECKVTIMRLAMVSEVLALSHRLDRLAERNRRYRDFTLASLAAAVREVIACLPVYRTYIRPGEPVSERDRRFVEAAVEEAKDRNPGTAAAVFDFVRDTLLLHNLEEFPESDRPRLVEWVMRFQQLSGPIMAKGVEDTAFYVYNRLVSLNEVGGEPDRFGLTVGEFHEHNAARARRWPHTLLATSTHDTKRSEDVRARIDVLSEMPDEWERAVLRWRELNAGLVTSVEGQPAPSRNDQYLFYQTLVGAWPPGPLTAEAFAAFRERVAAYMLKAIKEAKVHTSWVNANAPYDRAVRDFVAGALSDDPESAFRKECAAFQRRVAFFGYLNSLSQLLLKLTSPGVPDLYQGTELWDFSLVDPDNRRPVDYGRRRQVLAELREREKKDGDDRGNLAAELLAGAEDGRVKMYLTTRTLDFRRRHQPLFSGGAYEPLAAEGEHEGSVCAFARRHESSRCVVVACVRVVRLTGGAERMPVGPEVWKDTRLLLADGRPGERYRNVFTGEVITVGEHDGKACLWLRDVLHVLPCALLEATPGTTPLV